ncbi:carboxylesterase type B, partial [Aureobasidium melanogenum]
MKQPYPSNTIFFHLLRHNGSNSSPEITSVTTTAFPSVRINNLKVVLQTRALINSIIELSHSRRAINFMSTSLIKVDLDRVPDVEAREVDSCLTTSTGNVGRNGWVGVDDELAPDGHEGLLELGALGGCCGAEVTRDVGTVLSGWDGVLVLERGLVASMLSARCCWPVAREDSLMAVAPELPSVANSIAEDESEALELGSDFMYVTKDPCDIVVAEEREGEFQPSDEISFGCDVLRDEQRAFIGVVANEEVLSIHLLLKELRASVYTVTLTYPVSADIETGILQSCGVLVDQTFKDREAAMAFLNNEVPKVPPKGLIENTSIDGTKAADLIRRKETKGTETVLNGYANKRVVVGVDNSLQVLLAIAQSITTAMDPNEHWKIFCIWWSIDIEEQTEVAVLASAEIQQEVQQNEYLMPIVSVEGKIRRLLTYPRQMLIPVVWLVKPS